MMGFLRSTKRVKTDFMVIGSRQRVASLEEDIALSLLETELERVNSVKCLGVDIDNYLTWDNHMLSIRQKVIRNLNILKRVKPVLKTENLIEIYRSIIEPYFTCCCTVWDNISETQIVNAKTPKPCSTNNNWCFLFAEI